MVFFQAYSSNVFLFQTGPQFWLLYFFTHPGQLVKLALSEGVIYFLYLKKNHTKSSNSVS